MHKFHEEVETLDEGVAVSKAVEKKLRAIKVLADQASKLALRISLPSGEEPRSPSKEPRDAEMSRKKAEHMAKVAKHVYDIQVSAGNALRAMES